MQNAKITSTSVDKTVSATNTAKLAVPKAPEYTGHPDYTYQQFEESFYGLWSVSAGLPNTETRNMGWGIPNNGYNWFFDTYIMPSIAKGVKRFHIHLPHGKTGRTGEPMSYDALLEAKRNGQTFAYEHFYERIAEIYENHPDVVFLCYFGTLRYDPDIKPLLDEGRIDEWLDVLFHSIEPALKAPNIEIGFDASYGPPDVYGPDHPNYHFLSLIQSIKAIQGRRIYGEPKPHMDAPWWFKFPVLVIERFWHRSNPDKHSDATGAYIQDLPGPCLRMENSGYRDADGNRVDVQDVPDWRTWLPERMANILIKDGNRYGYKFQLSHGLVRILVNVPTNSITFGPLAENLQEIYDEMIKYAVKNDLLPAIGPILPEENSNAKVFESLEGLIEDYPENK